MWMSNKPWLLWLAIFMTGGWWSTFVVLIFSWNPRQAPDFWLVIHYLNCWLPPFLVLAALKIVAWHLTWEYLCVLIRIGVFATVSWSGFSNLDSVQMCPHVHLDVLGGYAVVWFVFPHPLTEFPCHQYSANQQQLTQCKHSVIRDGTGDIFRDCSLLQWIKMSQQQQMLL